MNKMAKGLFSITLMFTAVICIACAGITPMTVTASFMSLAGYTINLPKDCIVDPATGYDIYGPEEITSDRAAQEPEYMFLIAGKDAVKVAGPEINGSQYCVVDNQKIVKNESGFSVTINSHVSYIIEIDDFEDEISLAEVQLSLQGNTTTLSNFIFAAAPDNNGVARNIRITALVDGIAVGSKDIGTIEVRATREEIILISVQKLSGSESIMLDAGELEEISFTDFAFVVDFGSPVTVNDTNNSISMPENLYWSTAIVEVFAREEVLGECETNCTPPEFDTSNEVSIIIYEMEDAQSILVTPASGNFPAHSQIVLQLDFGNGCSYIERVYTE
jgi:hypothetical protein